MISAAGTLAAPSCDGVTSVVGLALHAIRPAIAEHAV
jgi:hypothetical protein